MEKSGRKHPRISSRIRVEFIEKSKTESTTVNVSRNGVFIRGESKRAVNGLVRLRFFIPPDNKSLEIFGRITWQGSREDIKGIGVHFMELASKDRDRWIEYVSLVEQLDAGESASTSGPCPTPTHEPEQERRKDPRTESSFMVRFKTKKNLESFVTKNLSQGGMFLSTPVLKSIGTKIQVVIIHPTSGKDFDLAAEVVRVNEKATEEEAKGMALKFLPLENEKDDELKTFLAD